MEQPSGRVPQSGPSRGLRLGMRPSSTLKRSATCSSTAPTLTPKWWKAVRRVLQGHAGVLHVSTWVRILAPGRQRRGPEHQREIIRWGGYSPEPETTCGGSLFNHDNVFHIHPITGQALLYISYWDAGLRIVDVSNPPPVPDPEGISCRRTTRSDAGSLLQCRRRLVRAQRRRTRQHDP